jgi:hypothetical protein
MTAEGMVVESLGEPTPRASHAGDRLISVVVPVVERTDDLVALYQAFAAELERLGEAFEFVFVFDGGFTPSPDSPVTLCPAIWRDRCASPRGGSESGRCNPDPAGVFPGAARRIGAIAPGSGQRSRPRRRVPLASAG